MAASHLNTIQAQEVVSIHVCGIIPFIIIIKRIRVPHFVIQSINDTIYARLISVLRVYIYVRLRTAFGFHYLLLFSALRFFSQCLVQL